MPENKRQTESLLNLDEEDQAPASEMIGNDMQKAQERLLKLQREQEQIEREKRELEELNRKKEELEQGRSEVAEKLTRSIVVIERQTYEAQKRVEQLRSTHQSFSEHLRILEGIDPRAWSKIDLAKELSKSISSVDQARAEYNQSRSRLAAEFSEEVIEPANSDEYEVGGSEGQNFGYWLKSGFAFTLPLLILGLVALILSYLR